eukprot:TRINITY_DN4626_c0_g2_i2.p1 TRINITY_DN4626_c0_g2~~TRINITY_DN4626_c0_g2_i2.p1  ORF type:complete len:258 (+),score=82.56 TRINITY_DN4626_c0_g2_i2:71-775(+)
MERKAANKIAALYRTIFHIEPPYKVIADGNFLHKCIQNKIFIKDKLEKYLGDTVQVTVTKCILEELKSLGAKTEGTYLAARRYRSEKCAHSPLSPDNCVLEHIGKKNKGNFFVATQDDSLKRQLRDIGRVGIITFNASNQLELGRPSGKFHEIIKARESSQQLLTAEEKKQLREVRKMKKEVYVAKEQKVAYKVQQEVYRQTMCMGKRRHAKGPNPLSCKKKKAENSFVKEGKH